MWGLYLIFWVGFVPGLEGVGCTWFGVFFGGEGLVWFRGILPLFGGHQQRCFEGRGVTDSCVNKGTSLIKPGGGFGGV